MSDETEKLRRDYRAIEAPQHLATRIRAEVADRSIRPHAWMPIGATLVVIAAAVLVLPYLMRLQPSTVPAPTKPSLSALAALKPAKPSVPAPSMSNIRSVKIPRLPQKPQLRPAQPQTQFENQRLEEKDHAYS